MLIVHKITQEYTHVIREMIRDMTALLSFLTSDNMVPPQAFVSVVILNVNNFAPTVTSNE